MLLIFLSFKFLIIFLIASDTHPNELEIMIKLRGKKLVYK